MRLGVNVYWEDECTGRIVVDGARIIENRCYIDTNDIGVYAKYPFINSKNGVIVLDMLKDRVCSEDRANIKEILNYYGLSKYNWLELFKKTHGACMDDLQWFKIDGNGDENLKFDDFHGRSKKRKKR